MSCITASLLKNLDWRLIDQSNETLSGPPARMEFRRMCNIMQVEPLREVEQRLI
jgi:hypothetical protein